MNEKKRSIIYELTDELHRYRNVSQGIDVYILSLYYNSQLNLYEMENYH